MIEKFWIVWNENKDRCDFPTLKHTSEESARVEAKKLATTHRGKSFSVMEVIGKVQMNELYWDYPKPDNDVPF